MRELRFDTNAWEELGWWVANDLKKIKRIHALLESISKTPFEGIGKPEPLKGNYRSYWSRRITEEHPIVYKVTEHEIIILQLKGHY